MTKKHPPGDVGRFAYEGLERTFHEKARLGIVTSLMCHAEGSRFSALKRQCALTEGNLNRHLEVLKQEGIVEIWKGFENRRPQTLCRITSDGRRRFVAYLDELRRVVQDARRASRRSATGTRLSGWHRVP